MMLPVACLPVAAILMGIGYWIDDQTMIDPANASIIAVFLVKAGGAIIDHIAILFAIGIAVGMSDDADGTSALAGLVSWLMITSLLKPSTMALLLRVEEAAVDPAYGKIENAFVGILCGLIGSFCYNKFKNTKMPDALAFFSGKRCVAIVTAGLSIIVTLILFFVWPVVYNALVSFGKLIINAGPIGAAIYGFCNRLLIPFGLHHALNSVFWFDIAGINDIGKFWGSVDGGVLGQTGMYLTGFFPFMMFGLPMAALAMVHTAKPEKRKITMGLMLSGALAAFFTGITEPIEFAFMFLAPGLYLIHAILAGISVGVCAALPVRSGFNFSAGFVDWFFSFKAPMAQNPWLILPIGVACGIVYYVIFRFAITKFNLKTPGREDDEISDEEKALDIAVNDFSAMALGILEGLGGAENVAALDNCITRLRIEVRRHEDVNEKKIKASGAAGIIRPSKTSVQVVIGTKVQFVADEMKRLL